jgi:hypothetical protein
MICIFHGPATARAPREISCDATGRLLTKLEEDELESSVDCDKQVELALLCSGFGDVDVEVADRVAFEPGPLGLLTARVRRSRDAMALQAAMQGGAYQMRDCSL